MNLPLSNPSAHSSAIERNATNWQQVRTIILEEFRAVPDTADTPIFAVTISAKPAKNMR
jgi:hypothetical protein